MLATSVQGQRERRTLRRGGARRPFDRCSPIAPFREDNDQGSRPDPWTRPFAATLRPREALRLSSDTAPRCLEIRFYNQRLASRAPAMSITSGDCPPSAVGNPPAFDFEAIARSPASPPFVRGTAPDHLAVIRPPATPCLTARRRLRVDRTATLGARARWWGVKHRGFLGRRRLLRFEPSDATPLRCRDGTRERPSPDLAASRCPGARQCRRAWREARGAFRRERPPRTLLRAPEWRAAARWPARAVAARLHRCSSRTPTRPFVRSLFTSAFGAACACATSASACLREHDCGPLEHPRSPGKATGTTAGLDRRSPFDPGQSPKFLRVRGRGQPLPRHSPSRLLAMETSPRPRSLRATSCREHPPQFPCPERRGEGGMPPSPCTVAKCARREGRATPAFREEDVRSPTRGAFRRAAARDASWAVFPSLAGAGHGSHASAFFTIIRTRARDARAGG